MRRTFALLGTGALLGAVAMYFARHDSGRGAQAPVELHAAQGASEAVERAPRAVDFLTLAAGSVGIPERAALFRLAAEADRRTLETLAAQVAALPNLEGRRLALEALFTRYAEIDAPAAAAFARTLGLPPSALTPLFTTWARNDPRAALRALGELQAPAALTLGIAMLEAIGNDGLGIARVLGAAPQIDADRFRIEAAIAKAADDPAAALEDILDLPPSKAGAAFERLAVIWIERDVHGAMAGAEQIADESLRNELKAGLMSAWARIDPDALVAYVVDLDPESLGETLRLGALQAFGFIDPQRALQAAESIPGDLGAMVRRAALMSLARDDPLAALRIAETLQSRGDREQMLSVIATSYGRSDPEAALAWAQGLSPPAPHIVANVLAGLARVDPDRAIDLLFETMDATNQRGIGPLTALVTAGVLDAERTAEIADRLLATPGRRQALQMLTQTWAQRQPHDAMRWLLARGSAAPRGALGQAAMQLGRTDPAAAIGYVDRVPPELRATWISSVAEGYAQNDARAAASWIAQHRGEPGYDAGLAAIAGRMASADPEAAATLFGSVNVAEAPDAPLTARRITAAWAQKDPRAAARWAVMLADEDVRATAVGAVAAQWSARDAAGARGWTLGLPAGAARDMALTQLLGTTTSAVDPVVVDAYSNAAARQRGITDAVRLIAARDSAAARQLADQYLTDPGARQAAERFIEQGTTRPIMGPPPPRLPPRR